MSFLSRLFRPRDPKPPPGSGWRVDGPVRGRWHLWNDTALMGSYTHRERAVAELLRQRNVVEKPARLAAGYRMGVITNPRVEITPKGDDAARIAHDPDLYVQMAGRTQRPITDESGFSSGFEVGADFASGPDTSAMIVRGGGGAGSILAPTPDYDAVDLTRAHTPLSPRYVVQPSPKPGQWFVWDRYVPMDDARLLRAYSHKSNATRAARKLNEAETARRAEEAPARAKAP